LLEIVLIHLEEVVKGNFTISLNTTAALSTKDFRAVEMGIEPALFSGEQLAVKVLYDSWLIFEARSPKPYVYVHAIYLVSEG
jgi:hypothetical protein